MKYRSVLLIFLVSIMWTSCQQKPQTFEFKMQDKQWQKFKPLEFDIVIDKKEELHQISFDVEVSEQFREENIAFQLLYETEEGEEGMYHFNFPLRDSDLKIDLASGDSCARISKVLVPKMLFKGPQKYHFQIQSLMPRLNTSGVEMIQIQIK